MVWYLVMLSSEVMEALDNAWYLMEAFDYSNAEDISSVSFVNL